MFPIRAVEDDDVDRRDVETWRHAKLTRTNSPIGLIALIIHDHPARRSKRRGAWLGCTIMVSDRFHASPPQEREPCPLHERLAVMNAGASRLCGNKHAFGRPGGSSGVAAPDPIPNSEVKRSSADGTLS